MIKLPYVCLLILAPIMTGLIFQYMQLIRARLQNGKKHARLCAAACSKDCLTVFFVIGGWLN